MKIELFWETNPPDFINEKGTKWWFDKDLTAWATREDQNGISLDNARCFVIQEISGRLMRVLAIDNDIVFESQKMEDIACRIDILKTMKSFEKGAK